MTEGDVNAHAMAASHEARVADLPEAFCDAVDACMAADRSDLLDRLLAEMVEILLHPADERPPPAARSS